MASYATLAEQHSAEAREHTLTIEQLTDQVRVLRDVLDEIREELTWAIRNDRVIVIPIPMKPVEQQPEIAEPSATTPTPGDDTGEEPAAGYLFDV